jgi:hypothetical protein
MALQVRGLMAAAVALAWIAAPALAEDLQLGRRLELRHPGRGHEAVISAAAVTPLSDGTPLLAWFAESGHESHVFTARLDDPDPKPIRVNPVGLTVASLHQGPGLAVGPAGEIYVTWSSPREDKALFSQDLRLSRSADGGKTFEAPLRVNEDRAGSFSFEGMAATRDGSVIVAWIESREGSPQVTTYAARVTEAGRRVASVSKVGEETCVCCRVDVTTGPGDTVALLWRKVFPDNLRDMVLGLSRDGGRTFGSPSLVHADGWKITACPHRGGVAGMDGKGRVYASWYTEGTKNRPEILFASSSDGRRFLPPVRLHTSTTSIPDHVRMAVDAGGRAVVVWEDSTAVRRRVILRYTLDGGRTFSPPRSLSGAIKAYSPDVALAPDGSFLVAWHEEQFPYTKTVVQAVKLPPGR